MTPQDNILNANWEDALIPPTKEWEGPDRRRYPDELLNHFEKQIEGFYDRIGKRLDKQLADAEKQHCDLCKRIDAHEERIEELMNTFTSHMTAVNAAFLHDKETGKPDYLGHYADHRGRKKFIEWLEEQRSKIAGKILEYAAIAFLIWMGMSIWQRVLQGPEGYVEPSREAPKVMEAPRATQRDTR